MNNNILKSNFLQHKIIIKMCLRYYSILDWKHLRNAEICTESRKRRKDIRGKNKKKITWFG